MVPQAYNPSTWEVETGGAGVPGHPSLATWRVQEQPELQRPSLKKWGVGYSSLWSFSLLEVHFFITSLFTLLKKEIGLV